jgi:hypothetical protein
MPDRLRFWGRALKRGVSSLNTWAGWFGLIVLALGVAAGIAVPLVFHVTPWVTAVILLAAVVVVLLEGSYLEWKDIDSRRRAAELALDATTASRPEVAPPGGAPPHAATTDYQINALRQIIAKMSETMTEFRFQNLQAMLQNYQRTGTDPVYEPLTPFTCEDGLTRLAELDEIEKVGPWHWRIIADDPPGV